jgi:hypothetical protein
VKERDQCEDLDVDERIYLAEDKDQRRGILYTAINIP